MNTGHFFITRLNKRRHLCYQTSTGDLGASPSFSQQQAIANARKVAVPAAPTLEATFTSMLRARGFVVNGAPEMDSKLSAAIEHMLFK
jgi:hypothetical protein